MKFSQKELIVICEASLLCLIKEQINLISSVAQRGVSRVK